MKKSRFIYTLALIAAVSLSSCGNSTSSSSEESSSSESSTQESSAGYTGLGMGGNADEDQVDTIDTSDFENFMAEIATIEKYSYEITSYVSGSEGHFIDYITPTAWYEENYENEESSFGYAAEKDTDYLFKYYLTENENGETEITPSIYEYSGISTTSYSNVTGLYGAFTLCSFTLLEDAMDDFECIGTSTNKFQITSTDARSVFQYMTTYGSSVYDYLVTVTVEVTDFDEHQFNVVYDLGDYGTIEAVYTELEETPIDIVEEAIANGMTGVEYYSDVKAFFDACSPNNYVMKGVYQYSPVASITQTNPYTITCTNDYFWFDYVDDSYEDWGYVLVPANTTVSYYDEDTEGFVEQMLGYDACYEIVKDENDSYYFDLFVGPVTNDDTKDYIYMDELPEASADWEAYLVIITEEDGTKSVYECEEDGTDTDTWIWSFYSYWYDTVGDFYINDISASFYMNASLLNYASMYYEKDVYSAFDNVYKATDSQVMTELANGLFGWGFQSSTTWMEYVSASRLQINLDSDGNVIDGNIGLTFSGSYTSIYSDRNFVYYNISDFGNAYDENIETFLTANNIAFDRVGA